MVGSYFNIYPNPSIAGTNLNIIYDLPNKLQVAELNLYDAVGKLIGNYKLDASYKNTSILLEHNLAAGVYKVCLSQSGNIIETKKLTIAN